MVSRSTRSKVGRIGGLITKIIVVVSFCVFSFLWIASIVNLPNDYPASDFHETSLTVFVDGRGY